MENGVNKPQSLCWNCAKACGKCSWSDGSFTPVPGWTAEKTTLSGSGGSPTESYHVFACPLFEDDTHLYNKPTKRNKWNSGPYMQGVIT